MGYLKRFRAISIVSALVMALALVAVSADVPIPIDDSAHEDGVYVQPVMVAGEVRGDWTVVACHVHVFTEAAGAGEVMTAVDDLGGNYAKEVRGVWSYDATSRDDPFVAGRVWFTVPAGATLTTTNTAPAVSGTCPGA